MRTSPCDGRQCRHFASMAAWPSPLRILPAVVAVSARVGSPSNAARAARIVAPVVSTSSTRAAPLGTSRRRTNRTQRRSARPRIAWRLHHNGARNARITGVPVRNPTPRARTTAGSTPYRIARAVDRGTGTSAGVSAGRSSAIAATSGSAAARTPRYLSTCTSFRAVPRCWKGARASRSPPTVVGRARGNAAAHSQQSPSEVNTLHAGQIMPPTVGRGYDRNRSRYVPSSQDWR